MKLTIDNYREYVTKKNWDIIKSLLEDLKDINGLLDDNQEGYRKFYIDIQDYHNVYSPERTDPCPDYYGYYTLRYEENPYETIGIEMNIDELDSAMCVLINFIESKNERL